MSASILKYQGALSSLEPDARRKLLARTGESDALVASRVQALIARVRGEGDRALFEFAREFDRVELSALEVPRERWNAALESIPSGVREALTRAARNIARAHAAQRPQAIEVETEPGVIVGRRPDPLSRVGVYAPGGRAVYPSSVLMGVVPAKVAGVDEVIVCSPPGPDGLPGAGVLAAATLAGADRVFALGGAGAVAALAYGTQSVPRVDRIVGPGNAYVAAAKLQVVDAVAIDAPAGPSEILVVADASARPDAVARELLAQAEHDPEACCVALVVGASLAQAVRDAVEQQARVARRGDIVLPALGSRGAVLRIDSLEEAWPFVAEFAPEHLLLATAKPSEDLARVRNAGTVFVGQRASVAFGDYLTGANHVLPTAGLARAYSGLSVLDFYRWTTWQRVTPEAAAAMADDVGTLADSEGLFAHAAAARAWRVP
ncbi:MULTISPECIES: histidinol dehydrogenase [unclassified Corallococcus]|uniref:histidinol dehydrogenase n=1 Tax=unclassified Corallococcus TaxID=2685029 RepID=UPI001A8DB7E9|nr:MULTISPECIES: histidinol dehydrogenase [unclassified Corallococcus]MBN9684869.1 histidinol dehydrogenase [Corallococcus sp. NCSPR001]WAS83667.1 histidinol dehydrogenase [Corallococcus sp. NCRR]